MLTHFESQETSATKFQRFFRYVNNIKRDGKFQLSSAVSDRDSLKRLWLRSADRLSKTIDKCSPSKIKHPGEAT